MENEIERYNIANENETIIVDFLSKFFDPFGYRKTGRSTVLAKAFIIIAYRYPNKWIDVFDHIPTEKARFFTFNHLTKMINRDYFLLKRNKIKYVPIKAGEPLDCLFRNNDIVKIIDEDRSKHIQS